MNKYMRRWVFVIGLVLIIGSAFFPDNNSFLHAQDNNGVVAYTGDPSYTGDPVPDDTKQITLSFKDEDNTPLSKIRITIDGKEYKHDTKDFVNGVLTLSVPKTDTQLIEFYFDVDTNFEPEYILLNEKAPDVKDNYNIKALTGGFKSHIEINVVDSHGNKKSEFENDESAFVSFVTHRPMTKIFYKIQDGELRIYDKPFVVNSDIKTVGKVKLSYFEMRYYPGDVPPSLDSDFNTPWLSYNIKFKSISKPDPDPSPSYPTFKDKDGNSFEEKDVKLDISALKNIDSFKAAIASYPEFSSIPTNQISYLDISVLAGSTKVQPVNKYDFVIPYPTGSTKEYEFVVYHFKNDDVKQPEKLEYEAKIDGLHVSVDSFSPFVVGWKEKVVTPPISDSKADNTVTNNINTGDSSESQIWLTTIFLMAGILIVQGVKLYRNCHED